MRARTFVEDFIVNEFTGKKQKQKDDRLNSFEAKFAEALAVDNYQLRYVAPSKFKGVNNIEKVLRKYIKSEGMKIYVSGNEESEMFVNASCGYCAIFLVNKDINESSDFRICAIAHELGHYLDYKYNFNYDSDAFNSYNNTTERSLEAETVAWAYAKDILEILQYDNWDYFYDTALTALSTYSLGIISIARRYLTNMQMFKDNRRNLYKVMC